MRSKRYLSAREQQIMDIVYQRGQVTATDVMAALPDTLSNSAVRTHLRLLEGKGQLRHIEAEGKYVYLPTHPHESAAQSALMQLLTTFFDGSVEKVMATLLSVKQTDLT